MGKLVVEQKYDPRTDTWVAEVAGKTLSGRTPRQLRSQVMKAAGDAEVEHRVRFDRPAQRLVSALVKEGELVQKQRQEYMTRLDKLNVEQLKFAEKLIARRCTIAMVSEVLGMVPTRLQQLLDPGHYAGQKVRAVRNGRLPAGAPPQRRDD